MKLIESIQLITFPAHCWKKVYAFLWYNKITNFDQKQIFQVKHIPFSINKHINVYFSAETQ